MVNAVLNFLKKRSNFILSTNPDVDGSLDLLTEKHAAKQHHIDADDILQVEDNSSASDAIAFVRRRFPGLISSSYAVETLMNKLKKECDLVLRPERCATGWKIRPDRLLACLQFAYLGCR